MRNPFTAMAQPSEPWLCAAVSHSDPSLGFRRGQRALSDDESRSPERVFARSLWGQRRRQLDGELAGSSTVVEDRRDCRCSPCC